MINEIVGQQTEIEISEPAVFASTPVVSVLMITYNHGPYLAEAINGVVTQKTAFPIELIIGEDCSTDNTRTIALDYQRRYPHIIRVVYSTKNIGSFNNGKRCFSKVRGEFVSYCEGDDYWHDELKLQKQVDFLRVNPDHGMVHSEYDYLVYTLGAWRRINRLNRTRQRTIPQGDIFSALVRAMLIRTCTLMGRTSLLKRHYDSQLRSSKYPYGDRPLVLHMSRITKVGYIDEPLATYRRAPDSYTNANYSVLLGKQKEIIRMDRDITSELNANESDRVEMDINNHLRLLFFSLTAKSKVDFIATLELLKFHRLGVARRTKITAWRFLMKSSWLLALYLYVRPFLKELDLLLTSFGINLRGFINKK